MTSLPAALEIVDLHAGIFPPLGGAKSLFLGFEVAIARLDLLLPSRIGRRGEVLGLLFYLCRFDSAGPAVI